MHEVPCRYGSAATAPGASLVGCEPCDRQPDRVCRQRTRPAKKTRNRHRERQRKRKQLVVRSQLRRGSKSRRTLRSLAGTKCSPACCRSGPDGGVAAVTPISWRERGQGAAERHDASHRHRGRLAPERPDRFDRKSLLGRPNPAGSRRIPIGPITGARAASRRRSDAAVTTACRQRTARRENNAATGTVEAQRQDLWRNERAVPHAPCRLRTCCTPHPGRRASVGKEHRRCVKT